MTNYRFLFGFFVAVLAALVILIVYFSGFPHWFVLSGLTLILGLSLGLLLRGRAPVHREVSAFDREDGSSGMAPMGFSADLLDTTVNEMRDGLVVIDAEMRVVASNRAARNLFSHLYAALHCRRLTELTT